MVYARGLAMSVILWFYRVLFGCSFCAPLNKFVMLCGLTGLGIFNYGSMRSTGESRFLRRLIKHAASSAPPGSRIVVFDVGANSGEFSEAVLSIGKDVCIYAFEPHPRTFAQLHKRLSESAKCFHIALGASSGVTALHDRHSLDGSEHATTVAGVVERIHGEEVVSHEVRMKSLDAFVEENGVERIHLLKIDVEGAEFGVLEGSARLLREGRIDAVQFEFNEMNTVSRVFFRDFWNLLQGYSYYRILPKGLLPIPKYNAVFCEIFAYQNIVALRPGVEV